MPVASLWSLFEVWPLLFRFSGIQIEQPPDHLMDGSSLRVVGGGFKRGYGRVQQFIDDAPRHRVNSGFLLGRDCSQLAADTVNFRLADGLTIFLKRKDRRH